MSKIGHRAAALALLAIVSAAPEARAQEQSDVLELEPWRETALLATSLTALVLTPFLSVDTTPRATNDWFPGDDQVKDNFSLRADIMSDVSLTLALTAPAALNFPVDGPSAERFVVYSEALLVNLGLVQTVKYLVQRPRPFTHSDDQRVRDFAARRGEDSYLSFFSSHASTTFTAAVAGSYLHGMHSDNEGARAAVWGINIALAAATANWRVRAGRHYYSDTLVGTLTGAAIGVGIPLLHARDRDAYLPSRAEWGAMAGGLALGLLVSALVPLEDDPGAAAEQNLTRLEFLPITAPGAAGMTLGGSL